MSISSVRLKRQTLDCQCEITQANIMLLWQAQHQFYNRYYDSSGISFGMRYSPGDGGDLGGLGVKVSPSNPSSTPQHAAAAAAPFSSASGGSGVLMPDMGLGAPTPPPSSIAGATQVRSLSYL